MQGSHRIRAIRARSSEKQVEPKQAKTTVVGYLRVSTEGQFSDGQGLDVQERAIRSFAESQSFEVVDMVTDCVSGTVAPVDRSGFMRVIELAAAGSFGTLLLYKFDRLARNVVHAVNTVHMLRDRYGIVARSVTEPIDTATPMGEMIFTVLASMAAQERHTITERTHGGRREKAAKGGFACGGAPIGYRADGTGFLHVVEEEAALVRMIFERRKQGETLQSIADLLTADGFPTRRGGKWRPSQVAYILDNPKYRGLVEYLFRFGTQAHVLREGTHQAII